MLLKDTPKQQEFKIVFWNRFHRKWKAIKEPFTSPCKEVLGPKKAAPRGIYLSWDHQEERGEKRKRHKPATVLVEQNKNQACEEHSHADMIAKQSIKANKRKYCDTLEKFLKRQLNTKSLRKLHTTITKLSWKLGKPERSSKDTGGEGRKLVFDSKGQKNRRKEHLFSNWPLQTTHETFHRSTMIYQSTMIHPLRRRYARPSDSWRTASQKNTTASQQWHWRRT